MVGRTVVDKIEVVGEEEEFAAGEVFEDVFKVGGGVEVVLVGEGDEGSFGFGDGEVPVGFEAGFLVGEVGFEMIFLGEGLDVGVFGGGAEDEVGFYGLGEEGFDAGFEIR